jgi:hypothetical protein
MVMLSFVLESLEIVTWYHNIFLDYAVHTPIFLSFSVFFMHLRIANKMCYPLAVTFGGLVVSMFATGPKVRGFKPGRGRWILRVIKSTACLPSEGK